MSVNNGTWDELPEQCRVCQNLKIFSLRMDGNHTYFCTTYPLHDRDEVCPEHIQLDVDGEREYEAAVEMTEYCERYEPTYNPEDGSM